MSSKRTVHLSCLFILLFAASVPAAVRVWEEPLTLPTYRLDPPDVNPRFYTNESYQGAQKRIYPYPMLDGVTGVREEKTYKALYLENEYVKLCILPEIGGRLWYATDKTNGYEIFYRQHVVKPALIGMLGAWVSGGIEWCVFHHHRNTTQMPVDYTLAENPDGSKTIWFGETERRHRMKWLIGVTLRPGSSNIEATVKLFNRTEYPHSILYWANVAVHVNDDYQVLFPPSVTAATYHSKNDFAHWPVANERYRGVDYKGVDLSWWKNHPEPVSFFAWNMQEDFMGGYDHGKQAGVVHVGDHHVVCGAKLWEWSPGPNGRMWDKILTDSDGPYAELMVGAWSDNQPDYSWIGPHEVKTFTQVWYPVRDIGGLKNANMQAAVNLELAEDGKAKLGFNATAKYEKARAILKAGDKVLLDKTIAIGPDKPFVAEVAVPEGTKKTDLNATLVTKSGETLIAYQPVEIVSDPNLPETVKPPAAPKDIQTVEELYLTGLRIEQIHNPRVNPFDYYEEALKRDPNDVRTNTIVGITYNRRGMYEKAEEHLRRAAARVTAEYTRARDAEALYHLGVALRAQGKLDEAGDLFHRASWDYAFRSAAYYQLAERSCRKGQLDTAMEQIEQSLATNALDRKALNLKAAILTRTDKPRQAAAILAKVLDEDPLDFLAANELSLARRKSGSRSRAEATLRDLETAMRRDVQAYLELATDYMNWGFWDDAMEVLTRAARNKTDLAGSSPLVYYYLGFIHEQKGNATLAREFYGQAGQMPSEYCFPFRAETAEVLRAAIAHNPTDAKAHYYLGNLLYEIQAEKAIECWERSVAIDGSFAMAHRNLGWASYRTRNDVAKAIANYERAVACNGRDARLLTELDELYELGNVEPARRLAVFEEHHAVAAGRNDSQLREIMVLVLAGRYDQAIDALAKGQFHVREGGGEIRDVYVDAHLLRGLGRLKAGNAKEALADFLAAAEYPENLSVGKSQNDPRAAQFAYYAGCAYEAMGEAEKAKGCFAKAAGGDDAGGRRGGFRSPEARFYRAMSMKKLGRDDEAAVEFDELIRTGTERLTRDQDADFFAKFGEQQTRQAQQASAHYTMGLGYLGKGDASAARTEFETAAKLNVSHVWARMQAAEEK
jgi:tetratricopeptide (TPR) repeat protein